MGKGVTDDQKKGLAFNALRYRYLACVDTLDEILYVLKCDHRCTTGTQTVDYIDNVGLNHLHSFLKNLIFLDSLGYSISLSKSHYISNKNKFHKNVDHNHDSRI